ncbi:MAG: 16S rRNA (guanine(966)-N(2))-methyltransferase RsmD [Spirochaetaceae bacterium]|jgi:16S rRNA (guanine(966)-N(2))-methyltransferase RsmD|nr:16S rRNA (guanine(966)-N(2))-methyltransferase RsmD [Spirochaetaceae bacterium]
MRITGGTLKGRSVLCPEGEIRPTMDKVRESLFSILGPLEGKSFLDLFGGSGAVSLEAFSRGAAPVVLVENDRGKRETTCSNISLAGGTITGKFMAAELFIKRNRQNFDIIFCDPPFHYRFHEELIRSCDERGFLAADGIFLMHRPAERFLPDTIGSLERIDQRRYGRSIVDFYGKQGESS